MERKRHHLAAAREVENDTENLSDSLKMSLLKPLNTAQQCELLGGRYFIRRLSALALLEQEEKATQAFEAGDMRQASLLNVQMLLDCLCDPDGQPIPPDALPTADVLMAGPR